MNTISREMLYRNTEKAARSLLGDLLVHYLPEGKLVGKIVETEAYLSENDPACHASRGKTRRNEAMFGPPGTAYVYLIYGIHNCFNVVTREKGIGEAVLIRSLEPLEGIDFMFRRRGVNDKLNLSSGPGKLCQALGITREHNGIELTRGSLVILDSGEQPVYEADSRIGISVAKDKKLRFYISDNPYVSTSSPVKRSGK